MLLSIYFLAYFMVLLGIVLRVGRRLDPWVCRSMIFVGTLTALVTACLALF